MKHIFLFFAGIMLSGFVYGQAFENGFDFTLPYNDTTAGNFLPQFPEGPITNADYVSVDDKGNFLVDNKPYRFFGVNVVSQGAFPPKEEAAAIAGRMHKYGINLVRFHHLDNPFSNGSLFYGINGTRSFNLAILDRLDYFIYQLKKHGIYVNMNLNVSRTFEPSDGVVDADSISDYGKGLTQFDPVMIDLEKEYAEMLLGHTNKYTGMPLSHDPVLAMVEIINENTLFRMWYSGNLRPIADGGTLPVYYNRMLDSLWNDFLDNKYDSTPALAEAWNQGLRRGDTIFYDGFEEGLGGEWKVELHNTAMATAAISNDAASGDSAVLVTVTATSDADWHTKFKYIGGSVKKDSIYEVIIKAKSDEPGGINISFQRENSPWTFYNGFDVMLDTVYKEYRVSFKAPEDNTGYLRIGISFMNQTGRFWFDDFVFKKQSTTGLADGENLDSANIDRVGYNQVVSYTKARVMDMTEFYAGIQSTFLREMHDFLTGPLGVTAPLTGTNWFTGPEDVYVQNTLDYIDNHSYWDHPSFPNTPWSATDWTIKNTPMLTSESGTVENLFNGLIVKGKPYTVSEYNHAFPNQYQAELLPIITSYLSFNDADGLMIFDYSGSWNYNTDMISGYFDIHRNTGIMGSFPLFSRAFRSFLIQPSQQVLEVDYSHDDIMKMPFSVRNSWSAHFPYDYKLGYTNRIEMTFDNQDDVDLSKIPAGQSSPYSFNDGQLYWDKQGLFRIDADRFSSITGYLNQFAGTANRMMTLASGSDFGGVHWLSLTDSALDESSRSLLAIGTRMMNSGMTWDGTNTVHNNWGSPPALVYPLQLDMKLKTRFDYLVITPLDEYGNIRESERDTIETGEDGYVDFILDQDTDHTLWYGIQGGDFTVDTTNTGLPAGLNEQLLCYPNPAKDHIVFKWITPSSSEGEITLFNLTGNIVFKGKIGPEQPVILNTVPWYGGAYYYRLTCSGKSISGSFLLIK